jgi:hypothetical protein
MRVSLGNALGEPPNHDSDPGEHGERPGRVGKGVWKEKIRSRAVGAAEGGDPMMECSEYGRTTRCCGFAFFSKFSLMYLKSNLKAAAYAAKKSDSPCAHGTAVQSHILCCASDL